MSVNAIFTEAGLICAPMALDVTSIFTKNNASIGLSPKEGAVYMNKKILTAALLGGLAFAQAASAQEFDDRLVPDR